MANKVVIDVSRSGQHSPETLAAMKQEALSSLEAGNLDAAAEIMQVVAEIQKNESEPAVQILELTEEEEEQREKDLIEFKKVEVEQARTERNARLAASDWTMLDDAGMTDSQRAAWAEYRKALRDLDFSDPTNIEWPEAP